MPTKVMLIRHAEKPSDDGTIVGVTQAGAQSKDELSVRGWQRAGALVRLFSAVEGLSLRAGFTVPTALFAPSVGGPVTSKRSKHTILPLAKLLALNIRTDFAKGDEATLVDAVLNTDGVALVCWPHQGLPAIAKGLSSGADDVPDIWPEDRFDVVWILDFAGGFVAFRQVPQLLLPGDGENLLE